MAEHSSWSVLIDTYRCLMQNEDEEQFDFDDYVLIDTYRCLMQNSVILKTSPKATANGGKFGMSIFAITAQVDFNTSYTKEHHFCRHFAFFSPIFWLFYSTK